MLQNKTKIVGNTIIIHKLWYRDFALPTFRGVEADGQKSHCISFRCSAVHIEIWCADFFLDGLISLWTWSKL